MPSPADIHPPFAVVALPAAAGGAFVALRALADGKALVRETACCGGSRSAKVTIPEGITGFAQACAFPGARARVDLSDAAAGPLAGTAWLSMVETAAKAAGELPPPTKKQAVGEKDAAEKQDTAKRPVGRQKTRPEEKKGPSSVFAQIPVSLCELSVPRPEGQGTHNVCRLPKGTVINGADVSGWAMYPRFANHPSSFHGEKFVDVPLLKNRPVKLYPPRSVGAGPMEANAPELCQAVRQAVDAYCAKVSSRGTAAGKEQRAERHEMAEGKPGSIGAAVGAAIRQAENGS